MRTNKLTNKYAGAQVQTLVLTVTVHTGYLAQSFNVNKVHPGTAGYEGSEGGGIEAQIYSFFNFGARWGG